MNIKKIARLTALAITLALGAIASAGKCVAATIVAYTGVSSTYVDLATAYYGTTPSQITVTSNPPSRLFLTYRLSDSLGQYFTWTGMTLDISINGNNIFSTSYNTYDISAAFSRVGVYETNSYLIGPMGQGGILVGCGNTYQSDPFMLSLHPGDVYQAKMTFSIAGQGSVTSVGTVTYAIPEPGPYTLAPLSVLCLLRRRRK